MAEPDDMILPLLREMRAENSELHDRTRKRLEKIEGQLESFRHARSADSLMSRLLTGEFEERIERLERKVRDIEGFK